MLNGLELLFHPCCVIYHFLTLAFSFAEHLETGVLKCGLSLSEYAELAILGNGTKICSENYCLLGCDANAVW
jgi:hypothetical protein